MKKSLKEEALDNLKAIGSAPIESKGPPSPVQALLGAISAGVIALILYKFTTTIEAALNQQSISDSYSVPSVITRFPYSCLIVSCFCFLLYKFTSTKLATTTRKFMTDRFVRLHLS